MHTQTTGHVYGAHGGRDLSLPPHLHSLRMTYVKREIESVLSPIGCKFEKNIQLQHDNTLISLDYTLDETCSRRHFKGI